MEGEGAEIEVGSEEGAGRGVACRAWLHTPQPHLQG